MKYPPACFSIEAQSQEEALYILKNTHLFIAATSLGGVESTIDWRHKHDELVPPTLLRVSVGIEEPQDLINDFKHVFEEMEKLKSEGKLPGIESY